MSVKARRNGGENRRVPDAVAGTVRLPAVSQYDFLLLALPLPLLAGVVASLLGPVSSPIGVGVGSLPSLLLLGYALFVAAPVGEKSRR